MAKRKTGKRGASFGNKNAEGAKRLVNAEFIASLEEITQQSLSHKLKKLDLSLAQYTANLIKDYAEGFELDFTRLMASNVKKERTVTLEAFGAEVLKKIYQKNPQLKSQRKKPEPKSE